MENGAAINFEADVDEDECMFVKDVLYYHRHGEIPNFSGIQAGKVVYRFDGNPRIQKKGTSLSIDISKVCAVLFHQLNIMESN